MTPTQQELYTHIKKHSGLMYSELFEDIGEPRGLTEDATKSYVRGLVARRLVTESKMITGQLILRSV